MTTIPHLNTDCQEDIPFETGEITRLPTIEPDTPLADFLAASYNAGDTDTAGADAAEMAFEEWLANEPEWDYWEEYEEVIA